MFTQEEKKLVVSALIFTACSDVCIDLNDDQRNHMIEIAKMFQADPIESLEIFGDIFEEEDIVNKVMDNFKITKK